MDDFKIWISGGTPSPNTYIHFGFDPLYTTSVVFDGTNDFIDCTNDATLWSQGLTKFSVSVKIFPTLSDVTDRDVFRHGVSGSGGRFRCVYNSTNIQFQVRNAADSADAIAISTALVLNQWNDVVCVYDKTLGSANVKIYVNGVLGGTTANLTETVNLSVTLTLAGASTDLKGNMKDFKWYTTTALTQTDVTNLYNGDDFLVTTNPDYWLLMNEGTGNPTDSISGTKVGTLTNGAAWGTGTAQTIANVNTAPSGVIWYASGEIPDSLGKITAGSYFPIWVKLVVLATASADPVLDDQGIFSIEFDIPQGGTGSGGSGGSGGGTGGNPPPASTDYKIAFAGDWGCEPETDDVIDLIQTQGYDLVVGIGDNAYESPSCWTTRFNPLKSIMKSTYGNHEYEESGGTSPYKTFLGRSETFYSFKFENILFLVIDSNDDKSGVDLDAQVTWATNELEAVKNDSTITWRIAVMHHPWFGASSDHSYNEFNQIQKFHSLFTTYKVSFVYTGHNHNWQRSNQVAYNSGTPSSPTIVDSSSPFSRTTAGLIHIVSGTGGHDSGSGLYGLGTQPSWQGYQNRTNNGVHELVASNNGQTLTGQFRNNSGDVFDTFTITA